jgi:CheY-like chemotaxis protein
MPQAAAHEFPAATAAPRPDADEALDAGPETEVADDRGTLQPGDQSLLIIEDDPNFAQILLELARRHGLKGLVAGNAQKGLQLARSIKPTAITLDLRLPDAEGWTLLDRIKNDSATRHIPVQVISLADEWQRGLKQGALAFLTKPVTKEALDQAIARIQKFVAQTKRSLLVVEDNPKQRKSIVELVGGEDVETTAVATAKEAVESLRASRFDCVVVDLRLPDMSGFELISKIRGELGMVGLPIIVYTGRELTKLEREGLEHSTEAVVLKDVNSPERLLDETARFLHRVTENLPEASRKMIEHLKHRDSRLAGRKVLVVDDDIRNIFSLTAVLESHRMKIASAESGGDAIETLKSNDDIDIVLMDIMMPKMDGYATIRAIRKMEKFRKLPIIAVTAKAMRGDRRKCIEAGATDYIAKPVDNEQLLSLLRVWLLR